MKRAITQQFCNWNRAANGGPIQPQTNLIFEPSAAPSLPPPIALTIAGLDPSSGAGITADLKTFAAHHLYGICCATALTVQSTMGVRRIESIDAGMVAATLTCLAEDVPVAGIKIGMLANAAVTSAVAGSLRQHFPQVPVVLDPVLRSTSGTRLLTEEGVENLRAQLLPQVDWITPNVDELAVLVGEEAAELDALAAQAFRLRARAAESGNARLNIVVTGGHLKEPHDYFLPAIVGGEGEGCWVRGNRVLTSATHGTGCAFSSALLCQVLAGIGGREAVAGAKAYVAGALRAAYPIGHGKGPMNHFFSRG